MCGRYVSPDGASIEREFNLVTRDTHEALISDAEAETTLAKLETSQVGWFS
jgi:hypothetical protein